MKINLWGVRGSIPTTGPDTSFYGGQTSCTLVSEGDTSIVLDAGSGIQRFNGIDITDLKRVDVLLTHLHMDHIQGLGFFKPFFVPDLEVHIWGPASTTHNLRSRLGRYLSPPLFPVLLRDLPCKLKLHEIGNSEFTIGNFKIKSEYVIHPGPTLGFRLQGQNSSFTYIPDHEPALGRNGMIPDAKWISGFNIASSADILYHDGQYSVEEYNSKKGWGHSSLDDVMLFAASAKVKHLLIAHHDPSHSDSQLGKMFAAIKRNNTYKFSFEMAKEGMELDLP
jgi:phosphoribosyl 1,2-cyclic phosphodiesterase